MMEKLENLWRCEPDCTECEGTGRGELGMGYDSLAGVPVVAPVGPCPNLAPYPNTIEELRAENRGLREHLVLIRKRAEEEKVA